MPARATLTLDSTCQNHCAAVLGLGSLLEPRTALVRGNHSQPNSTATNGVLSHHRRAILTNHRHGRGCSKLGLSFAIAQAPRAIGADRPIRSWRGVFPLSSERNSWRNPQLGNVSASSMTIGNAR